jgi:hypothetical protein
MNNSLDHINTLDEASNDKALPLLFLCEIRIKTLLRRSEDDLLQTIKNGSKQCIMSASVYSNAISMMSSTAPKKYIQAYIELIKLGIGKLTNGKTVPYEQTSM